GQVSDVYVPSTPNYSRTYLQTAPDGHIYAVSNDGKKLGRILQYGANVGTFQADVFQFPDNRAVTTYKTFEDLKYYILPENERVHTPLDVQVTTEPESCPDYYDGRAEIFVSGGVPFDDEDAPYLISTNPTANWQWDVDDFCFYNYELTAGNYEYTITDNATPEANTVTGTFVIELDNSHFSFPDTYFEVTEDKSLPDEEYIYNFYTFEKGIHIYNGATLTINNSEYEFGPDASIIIEPGAKLIVNNTILTNSKYCAPDFKLWKGIEVRGNSEESQLPEYINPEWVYHQGRLSLQDAVISFAETAITVAKRYAAGELDWSSGGGIVVAQGSQFINNPAAVVFIPYRNSNLSHFTDCSYSLNNEYISGNTFFKHIDLNQINDVRFKNCSFSVMPLPDVSPYNQGIAAYNSSFRVLPECEPETIPCPDENLLPSLFTGFYRAVGVYNDGLRKTTHFEVDNTLFISNSTGIYATNTDGAVMTDNTFEIGYNNTDCEKCGKSGALGIDLLASVNFVIENNGFSRHSAAQPGDYVGIRVTNCPSVDDDIYRNQFNGLSVGNMAVGVNRSTSTDDRTGVSYQCNENMLNDIDFWVKDFSKESRIRGNVGEQLLASGNTLTDPAFATIQFLNDYTQYINYYYVDLDNQPLTEYTDIYVVPILASNPNPCLPEHGSGGGGISLSDAEKTALELEYADGLADYNSVETLYNSLLDDGNTQAEIASLQAATPADM
ncbi:MAG: hypothetical protein KJ754_05630, partial [Bacteroidetes bacterium]|nr:hypothetical protein [Bacteroidota bacterium]MBU1578889.1 hypothetical protein [Bacteroidota bacterium]